ncbi:MAG: hypothetical protein WBM61_03385 [Woeseiaceae bacterium]
MLVALIVTLLLGGGSISVMDYIADTKKDLKTVIVEPDRRGSAMSTLKAMKKRAAAMNKQAGKSGKRLKKALQQHDLTDAAIDEIWTAHFASIDQFNRDMIDLRFQLKNDVTRDEWQQLFGPQQRRTERRSPHRRRCPPNTYNCFLPSSHTQTVSVGARRGFCRELLLG